MITPRTLQSTVRAISKSFPVLLLTGPRQVGKTTLLESLAEPERNYVTLDDMEQRYLAQSDPKLFLQRHQPPLIIDEVQYAPELFSVIKMMVDKNKQPGQFWLTGSQKFHLMQGITESLAGRVAVLDMLGMSQAEIQQREQQPFLPTQAWIEQARESAQNMSLMEVFERIWRGSFPRVALDDDMPREAFYSSYLQTYLQRDVRDLTQVGDERSFYLFIRAAAARTGQLLNYADLARDVDIDQKLVKSWLSILEASGIIYLLHPWHSNVTKRLIKTPKLYFLDTGLCSYLTQWSSPEALEAGAMSGAILETYMVSEIIKSYWHNGLNPPLYFYRDKDKRQIDLMIEQDNQLFPIEFKKSASPSRSASKHFKVLESLKANVGHGAVICLAETDLPLSADVTSIPVSYL
ncbi:ATP-binding protein [Leucothrix pacifica]|uniref:ATPase n=1 Tax=Leucothrix pacifica TaxID=1247513 RepID=A0A317C4W9_9GAMM|nr:ATP-binding protein [Leucothrix pacifica]PWQ92413.1 ATPase [Leucothrix pacifica]